MTKIKLCGLSRPCDIRTANELKPEYVGFVFSQASRRYVAPDEADRLKKLLSPDILAVGVFVDERPETVEALLSDGIIDIAQLHGNEDAAYIEGLKARTGRPVIRAFRIAGAVDIAAAAESPADYILLDSGAGTGKVFDWTLIQSVKRPYFLAGGLDPDNIGQAVAKLRPFAVDVSSGIETDGVKDSAKMASFVAAVRKEDQI